MVEDSMNKLDEMQIYTLVLFALYNFKKDENYLAASELAYVLDSSNFIKFISHFGGTTISIPTLDDISMMIKALLIYQLVDLEHGDFDTVVKSVSKSSNISVHNLSKAYRSLSDTLKSYSFNL